MVQWRFLLVLAIGYPASFDRHGLLPARHWRGNPPLGRLVSAELDGIKKQLI